MQRGSSEITYDRPDANDVANGEVFSGDFFLPLGRDAAGFGGREFDQGFNGSASAFGGGARLDRTAAATRRITVAEPLPWSGVA